MKVVFSSSWFFAMGRPGRWSQHLLAQPPQDKTGRSQGPEFRECFAPAAFCFRQGQAQFFEKIPTAFVGVR